MCAKKWIRKGIGITAALLICGSVSAYAENVSILDTVGEDGYTLKERILMYGRSYQRDIEDDTEHEESSEAISETESELFPEEITESISEILTEADSDIYFEGIEETEETEKITEEISEKISERSTEDEELFEETEEAVSEGSTEEEAEITREYVYVTYPSDAASKFMPPMFSRLIKLLPKPEKSLWGLRFRLESQIAEYDGEWSVCVMDLSGGDELVLHDESMRSASVMKLFILGTVYDAIGKGELERSSELVSLMSSMISASSNSAANELVKRLGGGDFAEGVERVNTYIAENGYSEGTHLYNGFQEGSLVLDPSHENHVSAKDAAAFLAKVYHRTLDRRSVCNEIEEWMLNQGTRYKIPKALPDNVLVGNKTGETDTIENDTAVVYTSAGDYILCVFSSNWSSKDQAQHRITDISRTVYHYFSDPDFVTAAMHLPADYFESSSQGGTSEDLGENLEK